MKETHFKIGTVPAILWGESAKNIYLFVHGKHGCKEAAVDFAQIAVSKNWAVLSFVSPILDMEQLIYNMMKRLLFRKKD